MPVQVSKVTHNNKGHFYRIAIDIAKEGAEVWDLTPYFKGRVGDDNFGLQIVWYYQGRLLDVTGKTPYIKGNVGHYSFDDKKSLQIASDADVVTSHGKPSDCQANGQATYYFPQQMFPTDGIFKGFIGLEDENQNLTGIDIWFRVLPGVAKMGHACDVYVDVLDKTIADFKEKIRQQSIDFDAALQLELQKEKDLIQQKLDAASDAMDEDTAALKKLAVSVGEIQAQIDAGNVITRKEYYDLADKIENTLAKMNLKPETFENEAALRAKYPNGVENELKVTADTGHKWLWVNGAWKDCGVYQTAGLPDSIISRIGDVKENLIVNGSFANGKAAPTTAVTDVDKFDVISDLGKNWVRLGTNGKIIQFVGVNVPISTYSINAYYPMRLQFDVQSSNDISLAVQVVYLDGQGKTIDIQLINTLAIGKWAPFHSDFQFHFKQDSYKKASTVQIRVVDTQAESIEQLTFTGFKLFAIYNGQKNPSLNLIENGDFDNRLTAPATQITPVDSYSVTSDLNRNWLTLGTNKKVVKYVGTEMPIAKYGTLMYYRARLQFDIQSSQQLNNVSAQIAYYSVANGIKTLINTQTVTSFSVAPWSPSHVDLVFNWDQELFKKATNLSLRIVDANEEAVDKMMLTGISLTPLYKGHEKHSRNLVTNGDFDDGLVNSNVLLTQAPVTCTTREYLGRNWLRITTNNEQVQYVGAHFPFEKGDVLNFYMLRLQFDAQCSLATTLAVQVAYLDSKGSLISTGSLKPLKINKYQLTHYNATFTLDKELYAESNKLEIRIIDNNVEVIDELLLTGVDLTVIYAGDSEEAGNTTSNQVTTINSSIPVIRLSGDTTDMSGAVYKPMQFEFIDGARTVYGYASIKWQGDSSLSNPKKAYRIKTFEDADMIQKLKFKPVPEWTAGNKWNLKAYYTDSLLGRDVVNARIGGAIWSTEKNIPQALIDADNFGFIDGFPVLLYINGTFSGVYSFNIAKGDYGDGVTAIEGARYTDATQYKSLPEGGVKLDGTDFDMVTPDNASDAIKEQINNLITFVTTSSDDDFKAKLNDYLDKESAIDYWIFCHLIDDGDAWGKNQQLLTYDGKKFFIHPYDLDVSFGNQYDGTLTGGHDSLLMPDNTLFKRLSELFGDDIKQRYSKLRSWLTPAYVIGQYRDWVSAVGEDNYEKEYQKWSNDKSDFNYLKSQVMKAFKVCDDAWL